ncbi:MAG: hypothetical protein U1F49_04320 [Rubrivivax sp.]
MTPKPAAPRPPLPAAAPARRGSARAPGTKPGPGTPRLAAIDWQKVACAIALQGRFTVITGGPGTGKTTTAAPAGALAGAAS